MRKVIIRLLIMWRDRRVKQALREGVPYVALDPEVERRQSWITWMKG